MCCFTVLLQWELDLHGLHVAEALSALQARVQLLKELAQDIKRQQLPAAPSASSIAVASTPDNTSARQGAGVAAGRAPVTSRQAVLTSLLLQDDHIGLTWEQQLAALRQELRVIVGKGLHSAGGEASLPRVVEQWLLQHGYRYIWRGGCIGVQLKLL